MLRQAVLLPARKFGQEFIAIVRCALQVWRMVPRAYKWALGGAMFVMVLTSAANTALPLLMGRLVDSVKTGVDEDLPARQLLGVAGFFLGCIGGTVLLRELLSVLRRFLVENTCTRIDKHLSVKVVSHLMQSDLANLTHEKLGTLHGRIFRSVDGYMRVLRVGFLDFLPAVTTGLFALAAALTHKQPWVGLMMIGVIPVSVLLTAWQLMSQKDIRLKLIRTREELDGTVVELLTGLDYVRVANTHAQEVKRVSKAAEKRRSRELRHHIEMSFFGMGKALTEGFFHLCVLSLAVYLAVHGTITFGDILTFSVLFLGVMTPLSEIHRVLDEGHEASLRVNDLLDILNSPPDRSIGTPTHREARFSDVAPMIEMDDLVVEYPLPDGRSRRALDGVGLAIRRGETLGVAGRSGCGKSTWLKVLMRLIHPTSGQVRLMGVPIEEVSREVISRLIGYVGQQPFVFEGTVEENICYGCGPCLPEDVKRAAEKACLHDEIMDMPDGYQTKLAEKGQNLSGGQRQRIALARIFLKDPPLLILDEATSALDNIAERQVQRAIDAARADRTVILVAHRLTTFADADRIVVFDNGRIAEVGRFDELVLGGGVFTELVKSAEMDGAARQAMQTLAESPASIEEQEPEPVGVS